MTAVMTPLDTLRCLAEIIELTYDHDDDGKRTDQAGSYDLSDIVDELVGLEHEIAAAITTLEGGGR